MQLLPHPGYYGSSNYEGEWVSELLTVTGNTLCIALRISVPKKFSVFAELTTHARSMAVYEAATATSRDAAMDLFSIFEVPLTAADGDRVQLSIYVSVNVTIKAVETSFDHCPNNSLYLIVVY